MPNLKLCTRCKEAILYEAQNADYRYSISDIYKRFRFLEDEMRRLSELIQNETAKELMKGS